MPISSINRFPPALLAIPFAIVTPLALSQDVITTAEQVVSRATAGVFELAGSSEIRATPRNSDIQSFLPTKGAFTFPAPWNTQAVRLTNASDCGGSDCVEPVGYSYWNNINNHAGFDTMLIFIGLDRRDGGPGPSLLEYNKTSGALTRLGPIFPASHHMSTHDGQGWYFSATLPTKLYMHDGADILRHDVMTGSTETVFAGNAHGIGLVWQVHSSADDRVHSATVLDEDDDSALGCMAYEEDTDRLQFFAKQGDYDECQVDKSGRWLLIKEDVDDDGGEDNRIIDLKTGSERLLLDQDGAAGHSDMGYGYMVAHDNYDRSKPNAVKVWRFDSGTLAGETVYFNSDWSVFAPAHISHSNARDMRHEQQYACGSSVNRDEGNGANEIICFTLDGSGRAVSVAPVMSDLDGGGGSRDDYENSPKGNLDVTGEYFIWTSNVAGGRMDAFLVKVPSARLYSTAPR